MKQLFKTLFFCTLFSVGVFGVNYYYQSYTLNNTAKRIGVGPITFQRLNVINTSTTSVWVKFYDFAPYTSGTVTVSVPTYTNNPKYVYGIAPSVTDVPSEIQPIIYNNNGSKTVLTFTANCFVRCTQGFAPTNTVTPSDSVYIDLDY